VSKSEVIGDCRLCGAHQVPLRDSHILPSWAYRRARDTTNRVGAPDPIRVSDGVAVQTSEQIKEYLLCEVCEQRLCKDENYVSKLAYHDDGTLGILAILKSGSVVQAGKRINGLMTRAAPVSHLDCAAIARFAASVFWRAHVAQKNKADSLRLWKPQAEALRKFVLGEAALPSRMCLTLFVAVDGEDFKTVHSSTLATPASAKRGDDGAHQFIISGLVFNLTTGTHSIPEVCLACGKMPHVIFQHWRGIRVLSNVTEMMMSAEPKGRGARIARGTPSTNRG
jgi:hypothetical protein